MATTVWAILSAIVGTPKHADPAAVGLGDLHCSHRGREVRPRAHPVPDPVEVVLQIGLELAQGHLVHPRGAPCWPRPAGTPPSPSAWESQTACPWALACSLDSSRGRSPG